MIKGINTQSKYIYILKKHVKILLTLNINFGFIMEIFNL